MAYMRSYLRLQGQNLELLRSLAQSISGVKANAVIKKSNMNNMLMQLRKCVTRPSGSNMSLMFRISQVFAAPVSRV